jgi:thiol:disulfide interchange protein DsbD
MLGVWNVVLPKSLMNRLSHVGGRGIKGAFLMGLVAGVLAAPCTGPIIAFILMLIAKGSDVPFGSLLMLLFSIGMGIPFLVLGTFSSVVSRLPTSGPWMEFIKRLFGAAMLAASVYYLSLVMPLLAQVLAEIRLMGSLAILLILLGIGLLLAPMYIGSVWLRFITIALGAAIPACTIAAFLTEDFSLPERGEDHLVWHLVDDKTRDQEILNKLLREAMTLKKPVMIDFYADWCSSCKRLEAITFKDPRILPILQNMTLVRIDATRHSSYISLLQDRFHVVGLPTVVFLDKNGHPIDDIKIVGFITPLELEKRLAKIK